MNWDLFIIIILLTALGIALFSFILATADGYVIIDDFSTWEYLHDYYNVSGTPQTTAGFTTFPANEIFLWNDTDELPHEYEHVQCNLNSTNLMERHICNQKIDTRDILRQSTTEIQQTPEPPKMTGKLIDSIYGRATTFIN